MLCKNTSTMVITSLSMGLLLFSGCTSYEVDQRDPNVFEREGMAITRVLSSPIDLLGPTYATYDHLYTVSDTPVVGKVFVTPFVPLLTLFSGTFVTLADVVVGPCEMLTFSQFSSVAYPWESYEYRVAEKWNTATPIILISLATAGAGAAMAADAMSGNSGAGYSSGYTPTQSYQSSGVGSGASSSAGTPAAASKPANDDIYKRYCPKPGHGEYDSRFSPGGCPACKAPKFAE